MSIIDKTREQLAAENHAKEMEKFVLLQARDILPHVANCSPHLPPEAVVERAIAITRVMHDRLLAAGCTVEGSPGGPIPIVGAVDGLPPFIRRTMGG